MKASERIDMASNKTPDLGPAQRDKLQDVIREIKVRRRYSSYEDFELRDPYAPRHWASQLQILAGRVVPEHIAERLDSINAEAEDDYDENKVQEDLRAIAPLIEDALGLNRIAPNRDLPEDIQRDFREAQAIRALSPRGAAALLRLCIQKLCIHLGEQGKNLNQDIGALVKKGLSPRIQQALDIVRVIGNEAVHPGTIDLEDDVDTTSTLLVLVNRIADALITQPKEEREWYDSLPESKRQAIERRDSKEAPD